MGRNYNPEDFIIQYPGKYPERIRDIMDDYFERVRKINETEVTGEDVISGRVEAPKLSATITLTEEMLLHFNDKYAPDYKVNLDKNLAQKYGHKDIFAMIGMTCCDEAYNYMMPPQVKDTVLVSQIHSWIKNERLAYAGDTLYMVRDKVEVNDLTPAEGSVYRSIDTKNYGTIYNQNGEVVSRVMFSLMESMKIYKDECLPKPREQFGFPDMWEDPDWFSRPLHKYTDEDYEYFKEIWKNEITRQEDTLYWEDVRVGEILPLGTFGPIKDGVIPLGPYGMGVGGSRNLKPYFMNPETEKQMITDEVTGIKQMPDPEINTPPLPTGIELPVMDMPAPDAVLDTTPDAALDTTPDTSLDTIPDAALDSVSDTIRNGARDGKHEGDAAQISTADIHGGPQLKSALLNLFGRDLQITFIQNYAGYEGRIKSVAWNIMPEETHEAMGKPVPIFLDYVDYLKLATGKEHTTQTIHGCTTDVGIMHGEVIGKRVVDQEYIVTFITWVEDINGDAWSSAKIEVVLPSKNK